jgi:hypothetical protein
MSGSGGDTSTPGTSRRRGKPSASGKKANKHNSAIKQTQAAVSLTLFTSSDSPLSKHIGLTADGTLHNDSSASLAQGHAERLQLTGLDALAELIAGMTSSQALALGALKAGLADQVPVVTQDMLAAHPGAIARTRANFVFGKPTLVLLDHDRKGTPQAVADRIKELGGFWGALCAVWPALGEAAHMLRASTSAGLSNSATGHQYPTSGGVHAYVIAEGSDDIAGWLKLLHQRCWLAGLGWMTPSRVGSQLDRSIIDCAVGQPERLVFEGPPVLDPPLVQDAATRAPVVTDGAVVDISALPPLTDDEIKELRKLQAKDGKRIAPDCEAARARRIQEYMAEHGCSEEKATRIIAGQAGGTLDPDNVLVFFNSELGECTVADVLADPARYIGRVLADPVEGVNYGRQKAKLLQRHDGTLFINSFAHGGIKYELKKPGAVSFDDFHAYMPKHNYIFIHTGEHWPGASVNSRLAPVQVGEDEKGEPVILKASTWLDQNRSVEQLTWLPGQPMVIKDQLVNEGGLFTNVGKNCFNTYRPPTMVPGDARKATPWLKHVHKLYPGKDGRHIIRFCAHRVQRPDKKINHALVLGSEEHGIGKDTLLEPVKRAVGEWNYYVISPQDMMADFRPFLKSVILLISEVRDLGEFTRYTFYDHMKSISAVPPDTIMVNEKFVGQYRIFNFIGIIYTTNHKTDGLYLPAEDRRHYVAWSKRKKADFTNAYWDEIWAWYNNGGAAHVMAYLMQLDLTKFNAKVPPPKTDAFWAIVNANRPLEDAKLADVLDKMNNPPAITLSWLRNNADGDFQKWLCDQKNSRAIPHRLETCGYVAVHNSDSDRGFWTIDGRRQVVYAKASLPFNEQLAAAEALKRNGIPM